MSKNLNEWLSYIETLHPKSVDLGLERVKKVANRLFLLPFSITAISVAGTNGKGSTVRLLEQIYLNANYRVGSYFSPHIYKYNERIHINGNEISDEKLCEAFEIIEQTRGDISLTYFEFGTLAALYIFKQQPLDLVILEVGLGGRLDAVNILDAEVSVITSIAMDHMEYLGNTREEIAMEKAGVMRSGKFCVCGDSLPPDNMILFAKNNNVEFSYLNHDFYFQMDEDGFSWRNDTKQIINLPTPKILPQNAATVLQVVALLQSTFSINKDNIRSALANAYLPGRQQIIQEKPLIMIDVAHNPESVLALQKKIYNEKIKGKTYAVFSMLADKNIEECVKIMKDSVTQWYIAPLSVERAATIEKIKEAFSKNNLQNFYEFENVQNAFDEVKKKLTDDDRVIVFGSFHTIAEIKI